MSHFNLKDVAFYTSLFFIVILLLNHSVSTIYVILLQFVLFSVFIQNIKEFSFNSRLIVAAGLLNPELGKI